MESELFNKETSPSAQLSLTEPILLARTCPIFLQTVSIHVHIQVNEAAQDVLGV